MHTIPAGKSSRVFQGEFELYIFLDAYIAPWRTVTYVTERLYAWECSLALTGKGSEMARKQERPPVTFVNIRLDLEAKAAFATWATRKGFDWVNELQHAMEAGFKYGVTYDSYNQCFIVSTTCWGNEDQNYGVCFSSRHSGVRKAFELALYKLLVVLDGAAWLESASQDDWG